MRTTGRKEPWNRRNDSSGDQKPPSLRTCIVTGESLPRDEMLRFVSDPENRVLPDVQGKLPGKGAWIRPDRAVFETAVKKNLFCRAFRKQVTVPGDLFSCLEKNLSRQCLDLIGLAWRTGQARAGFEKTEQILRSGKAGVYVSASESGSDNRKKLESLCGTAVPVVDGFYTDADLGASIGRETTHHMALLKGDLCGKFLLQVGKLKALRSVENLEAEKEIVDRNAPHVRCSQSGEEGVNDGPD